MDGGLIREFDEWGKENFVGFDNEKLTKCHGEAVHEAARRCHDAAVSEDEGSLCDFARDADWPWVRLAAAGNEHCPVSAMWGDGLTWYGLAGDDDPWVRAVALLKQPDPPQAVVDALIGTSQEEQ